jgi:hypothetical protein
VGEAVLDEHPGPADRVRAAGVARIHATGPDLVLPVGTYGVPVVTSATGAAQADPTRLVKTAADAIVTAAGVDVPVISMLGGAHTNLPLGSRINWTPTIPGVEVTSSLSLAMTGGLDPTAPGTLRRVVSFDQLGIGLTTKSPGSDVWRAKIGAFPAGVLAWTGSTRGERTGIGARMRQFRFRLFVVSGVFGGSENRMAEAEAILDYCEGLLEDRSAVDDEIFSNPGIAVVGSGALQADDGSYVYFIDLECTAVIERIDARQFSAWLETQTQLLTDPSAEFPDPANALVTVDFSTNQP